MRTLLLALRNLLRNRRRSLTTFVAIIVGAQAILLFGGFSRDITYGLQTGYVEKGGHLQIQHKDYFLYGSGNPSAFGIEKYKRIIATLQGDPVLAPMLVVVTPTLQLNGIGGNFAAGVSRTVSATGLVVDDQNRMRKWNDYGLRMSLRGDLALTGAGENAAIIGTGVARVLQLCNSLKVENCVQAQTGKDSGGKALPDDIAALAARERPQKLPKNTATIELLAASAQGAPNVAELDVVKAENQGFKELDDTYVVMRLPQAQRLVYGADKPQVTAILLQLKHTDQIPKAKARVSHLLEDEFPDQSLEIQDFATLNPFYGQVTKTFSTIFAFIAVLIGAITLFMVGNTMNMAIVERTAEIGTLRAMGLRRAGIRRLFVCEGLLLGAIGAGLGVVIAIVLGIVINHSGLTWLPPGQVNPVPLSVRVWGESRLILSTAIGLTLVAAVSAWWPARRAAGMNIVEALRHV